MSKPRHKVVDHSLDSSRAKPRRKPSAISRPQVELAHHDGQVPKMVYSSDLDELAADAMSVQDEYLPTIKRQVERTLALMGEAEALQAQLVLVQAEVFKLQSLELPELMIAAGLRDFTMTSGHIVELARIVTGQVPKEPDRRAIAFGLIRGLPDGATIIKHELSITFDRSEDAQAAKAKKTLEKLGLHPKDQESVHAQTLAKWAREQLDDEKLAPKFLAVAKDIGIFIGQQVKIKEPKSKRST